MVISMTQLPLVLLLPHPDDEFAVFAWIEDAQRAGRAVHCLWLTDGGWGGQEVSRRRMESEKVLTRMGLNDSSFHFIGEQQGLPDGELHHHIVRAYEAVADCIARIGDAQVLVPAWEGGHQDHDIAHLIGAALARRSRAQILQYSIYQGEGLAGPMFRIMHPLPANGPVQSASPSLPQRVSYVTACLDYRSQWKSFIGLLPFYALRMFSRHPFQLQSLQEGRTRQRPHQGALLYERRGGPTHEAIVEAGRTLDAHLQNEPYRASKIV